MTQNRPCTETVKVTEKPGRRKESKRQLITDVDTGASSRGEGETGGPVHPTELLSLTCLLSISTQVHAHVHVHCSKQSSRGGPAYNWLRRIRRKKTVLFYAVNVRARAHSRVCVCV